ncbi:MAG: hypothetical protein RI968_224 [Pseudomonadota bacterium]
MQSSTPSFHKEFSGHPESSRLLASVFMQGPLLLRWLVALCLLFSLSSFFSMGQAQARPSSAVPPEISWDDLIDERWAKEMQAEMMALGRLGFLKDGTEAADRAMEKLRRKWDEAPIVRKHLGQSIRIPGYVVPLDADRSKQREFLLVPYFGACIHTPPPPANQIILVSPNSQTKMKNLPESMATVWVHGVLEEARVTTSQGVTGYRLVASAVLPYEEKR